MSHLTLKPTLEQEYPKILEALQEANFNKTKAAKLLGIDRKTLYLKLARYQKEVLKNN